jgi:hypothetical protein
LTKTETIAPTCTRAGIETGYCPNCGETVTRAGSPDPTAHSWGSWRGFGTTQTRTCLRDTSHTDTRVNPNPGTVTVSTPADYAAALAEIATGGNNQNYTIVLTDDLVVPGSSTSVYPFGTSANITVTITGNHKLTLGTQGNLLHTGANQNIILQDVKLVGHNSNSINSLVNISGGSVTMNGNSSISGNTPNQVAGTGTINGTAGVTAGW